MAQPSYQGRFIWQELHSRDPAAAVAFYCKVMAWTSRPFSPGSPYRLFIGPAGTPVAGAMQLTDDARAMGASPQWLCYIGAGDVDATVAHATRLGGRVLRAAEDMPGVGRIAVLADPQGAVFAVFRPLDGQGRRPPEERGHSWFELAAQDRATALEFYRALFGWELRTPMDMGGGFQYQSFGLGNQDFGGAYSIRADRPMPPSWLPYGHHRSADEGARLAVAAGARVLHGPSDVPGGGRMAQLADPEGIVFAIFAPSAVAKASPAKATAPARKPATAKRAGKAVKKAAKQAVKKAKQAAGLKKAGARKKVARKAGRKAAPKVARKVVRKSARKAVRKAGRKAVRKATGRTTRKSGRRPARKK